jgi:hypothetical protein
MLPEFHIWEILIEIPRDVMKEFKTLVHEQLNRILPLF